MKNVFNIIRLILPFKKWLIPNILFNLFGMLFAIFSFAAVIPLLKILFSSDAEILEMANQVVSSGVSEIGFAEQLNQWIASNIMQYGKSTVLMYICGALAAMVLLKNFFIYLSAVFLSMIVHTVSYSSRNKMHSKFLKQDMAYFSDEKTGDLISRFTADTREIEFSILACVNAIFKEPLYIVGLIVSLFLINVNLSLFIIIYLPLAGAVIALLGKGLKRNARAGQNEIGNLISTVEESLAGRKVIRGFNAEEQVQARFEKQNGNIRRLMIKIFRTVDIASPASEVLGVVATAGVLLYGGRLVFSNELDPEFFIGYLILFSQLITPFKSISKATFEATRGNAALNRIKEITEEEIKITSPANPKPINGLNKSVKYDNISFKYGENYVLKNVDFEIPKGKSVALVGQSGSGKSTLADLLPRFYDVNEGSISIDDVNIKDADLFELRDLLGIVTQQSILFNDTVYNNIAFGVTSSSQNTVEEAAKIANAHEFIMQLPEGYQTNIGDGGGKLSGGQKQRLSIARAVLKDPEILILDEATSALDTESEKLVQEALNNLMKNRTSLVIAHRLSTIQHADEIIVLHEGEIIERGNHETLITKAGTYKKLIDMQSFG